jgi:hypothetical protein
MGIDNDLDDIEPLSALERCKQYYGAYHIGREDETRDEVALFFDAQMFPDPDFVENRLWSIINRFGGRLSALASTLRTHIPRKSWMGC